MDRFGVPATARATMTVYNDREDIDRLVEGLAKIQSMFA
jgi:cysteine desulfurase/selenocysteine lyase